MGTSKRSLHKLQSFRTGFDANGLSGYSLTDWDQIGRKSSPRRGVPRAVYILSRSERGPVKIGVSEDPYRRAQRIKGALCQAELFADPFGVERAAHEMLWDKHIAGEWFNCSVEHAREVIARAAKSLSM